MFGRLDVFNKITEIPCMSARATTAHTFWIEDIKTYPRSPTSPSTPLAVFSPAHSAPDPATYAISSRLPENADAIVI